VNDLPRARDAQEKEMNRHRAPDASVEAARSQPGIRCMAVEIPPYPMSRKACSTSAVGPGRRALAQQPSSAFNVHPVAGTWVFCARDSR